ncbi:hypothetical protein ASPBRDRAFT_479930 [Aspergillus brasiliensis CBS 101740]|uniref:Uncharacterized protein n=1 Tax=Aspergillus brasiliensis (strain CBS 101740 / IMI 381727 / IBT 21946) TaxID=767769 RepID=A0A1L9UU17_ASPBC|nr:hypothetical protein ASPBRDRAFT_479930 [Aspergillus brasiliensis CBS 101740]
MQMVRTANPSASSQMTIDDGYRATYNQTPKKKKKTRRSYTDPQSIREIHRNANAQNRQTLRSTLQTKTSTSARPALHYINP